MPTIPAPAGYTPKILVEQRATDYHIGGLVVDRAPTGFAESIVRIEADIGAELQTTDPITGYNLIDRKSRATLVDKKLSVLSGELAAAVAAAKITQAEMDDMIADILAVDAMISAKGEKLIALLIKAEQLTLPHVTEFAEQ